jgi:hypothetical protein
MLGLTSSWPLHADFNKIRIAHFYPRQTHFQQVYSVATRCCGLYLSARRTVSTEEADELPNDDKNLINKVINPESYLELQLIELKKLYDYCYIYQARQLTSELLLEVKVSVNRMESKRKMPNAISERGIHDADICNLGRRMAWLS